MDTCIGVWGWNGATDIPRVSERDALELHLEGELWTMAHACGDDSAEA